MLIARRNTDPVSCGSAQHGTPFKGGFMFKFMDTVRIIKAPGVGLTCTVLEVDPIGNIRVDNGYPPVFHKADRFELDDNNVVKYVGDRPPVPLNNANGIKHDQDKPDMSLLSPIALEEIAKVMTFGKKKYTAHNWRGGFVWSRPLAAAMRHLVAFIGGQDKDPETGLSHLAHCACCIMFLLEFEHTRKDLDDRYKPEVKNV